MSTIIILHGWGSSKEKWKDVQENLEIDGFRVFVPDIPGFKKETALGEPWDLNDYVQWLEEFLDANHIKDFFLVGHSFGGRIAIKFAVSHPLKALILVASAGIKKKCLSFSFVGKMIRFLRIENTFLWKYFRKFFYKCILRKTDYLNTSSDLKETMKNVLKEDLTPLLEEIKIPTLLIWGDKDKYTPLKDGLLMNKKIKNSRIEILKGIGHTPYSENPNLLSEKIKKYVTSF